MLLFQAFHVRYLLLPLICVIGARNVTSLDSTAEAAEGEGGDASGERTSTPSTSVMSESDLEYGEGTLKAESPDSGRLEEKEEEEESTIPLLSSSGGSPKTKLKVTCSPDIQ